MSKPTLEEMQRICEAEYGSDMIREWPWVQRSLERLSVMLETQERCEERVRDAVKFGMRITYSWACNETDTDPEAFERFVEHHTKRNQPEFPDGSPNPEPTPEAVSAFNARQLEFRRVYLLGYAEVLPEHRAEGVVRAAERFPLKRLVVQVPPNAISYDISKGLAMKRVDLGAGNVVVEFSSPVEWLNRRDLQTALAMLDAAPRVEDVPLEEEEDA